MTESTFHLNQAGMEHIFHSEDGPVGQSLARLCNRIVTTAKERANVDTGLMRSRIEFTMEHDGSELVGVVAARTDYAIYVHEGTAYYQGNPYLTDALAIELDRGLT